MGCDIQVADVHSDTGALGRSGPRVAIVSCVYLSVVKVAGQSTDGNEETFVPCAKSNMVFEPDLVVLREDENALKRCQFPPDSG